MRVLALALLLVLPLVAGQGHEHGGPGGPVAVVTDLHTDGLAFAGTPAHFAVVAFGSDDEPDFHQDMPVRVLLDDVVLWQTTAASGHDYDGIVELDIVFPHPGTWRVEALDADGGVLAHREGTVVERVTEPEVTWLGTVPATASVLEPLRLEYGLAGAAGLLNHTDVVLELYRDGLLVFRTHTHTHTETQSVGLRFPEPGEYTLRRIGYQAFPTEDDAAFRPVVDERTITVTGVPPAPVPSTPTLPGATTDLNAVVRGEAGGAYQLLGAFDPYTVVGPGTLQHLSALVVDPEERALVQHVDFEATLTGPAGELFSSSTLHEYDGIYELATQQTLPGTYRLAVTASYGDWSDAIELVYVVAPPAAATVAGPQVLTLTSGALTESQPSPIEFRAADAAGNPFAHGELEIDLRDRDGLSLLHAKLHTHGDGAFPATVAVPAGSNPLHVTPFPLMPQPALTYHQDELGTPLGFRLDAEPGAVLFDDGPMPDGPTPEASIPGLGLATVLGILALGLLRRH